MADSETGRAEVAVSHRSRFDADQVKIDLGIARNAFSAFMDQARALSERKLSRDDAAAFVLRLLGGDGYAEFSQEKREETLSTKHAQGIASLYAGGARGADLPSAKATAWGMVNAITEYVDHFYPSRTDENRLHSAWFGNGNRLKDTAMRNALALV